MKVPLSWLGELVAVDLPLAELRQRLTMAGLEVEEVHQVGADWRDVRIGRIVDLDSHPRREALKVARVDLGDRSASVVTGATNLRPGDLVPYVAPGGRLPGGEVGSRDFAGIRSEGMVCSGDELRISPDKDGIYVFEPDAPVGETVQDFLHETVLDIYITANRPDCMSMMGVAREVHALFGTPYSPAMLHLQDPATARVDSPPGAPPVSDLLQIEIDDPSGCPRFSGSVVRDIRIGPSPVWLQRRLHFAGVRPISNVVDVTNYVMLEVGQPLHAFDRSRFSSPKIVVRRARADERLRTLDGAERVLTPEMMVVADEQRARSLAGVMGGEDSEIADGTRDVILEGASWDRASIRRASAALELSSEASRRFGRGVDPDLTALGVARATKLTLMLAGGSAAVGLADEYPGREPPRIVQVRPEHITALLGMHFTSDQVVHTLSDLGFEPVLTDGVVSVTVPGWRRFDVEGRADLAEEVGRIAGFDLVPSTMPSGALPAPRPDGDGGYADELRARRVLAAAGLQEVITYSLVDPALAGQLVAEAESDARPPMRIANPQSIEQSVLRPSLLGGLLSTLRSNLRQRDRVQLFELARTWRGSVDSAQLPDERRHVGVAMVGPHTPRHWSGTTDNVDFFDIKGVLDALCGAFRVPITYAPGRHPSLHPGRTAEICAAEQRLGILGQLHPAVAERFDLESTPVFVAELDFERLLQAAEPLLTVQTPSRFPSADRDIAIVVDENTMAAEVEEAIREAAGPLLESVQLFDLYRGENITAGRKSLAFALRYRAADHTLEDDEVSGAHTRVEQALRQRFRAEVRGR
jgi:phenylalanyl-tRNA synthetase beta chain